MSVPTNPGLDPAARRGRWTELVPLTQAFYPALWDMVSTEQIPWQWRGRTLSQEGFIDSLWADVLVQFAVLSRDRHEFVGLIGAYNANLHHQHAYVQLHLGPDFRQRGWPVESLALFAEYVFRRWNFHKLYGEVTDRIGDIGDIAGIVEVEATLKEHFFHNGEWLDLHVLSITRQRWFDEVRPELFRRLWRISENGPDKSARYATPHVSIDLG